MNNFIQLLKSLKTPAKYLLYFFIAFVLFYLFGQPPEFRDEVTKKIRLYTENYIDSQQEKNEAISIDSIPKDKNVLSMTVHKSRSRWEDSLPVVSQIPVLAPLLEGERYPNKSDMDHKINKSQNAAQNIALK